MLIDKIKEEYLKYFELREDNMLDIVRINTRLLDTDNFLRIRLYLERLERRIIGSSSFEGRVDDSFAEMARDYVSVTKNSVLSFLVREWNKEEGYLYLPLFLLHYSFPALKDFLTKWKQTQTDSPEFEEKLMNSRIYISISHMDDLPNFDKNILNYSDKNHIAPAEAEVKLKGDSFWTRYFDKVSEKITPQTRWFLDSTGDTHYYDYQIISKNRINHPNTTNFITVYADDGSKVLRPIPKTTIPGQSINTTALVFIPKSIEVIRPNSFIHLSFLLGIIFEDGSRLKCIAGRQFTTDFLPKSFKLPDSVEVIGDKAFMLPCDYNIPLHFFCFPKNLKKIGKRAFFTIDKHQSEAVKNRRLYSSLPEGVESIGDFAFATGGSDVRLKRDVSIAGISLFTIEKYGIVYWSNSIIPYLADCKVLTVIGIGAFRRTVCGDGGVLVIPPSVEEIGDYAFSCVKELSKVIFSAGTKLKYLGKKAFFGCLNLSEVVFETPPPLERISYMAFAFTNLETVDLSNFPNLKVIEACAFVTYRSKYQKGIIQPKIIKNPRVIDYGPFRVRERFKSEDITVEKIKDGSSISINSSDFEYLRAPTPKYLHNTYKDTPEILINIKYKESCFFGFSIEDCTILEYLEYLNSDKYLNGESPRIPSFIPAGSSGGGGVKVWDRRRDLTYSIRGTYSRTY